MTTRAKVVLLLLTVLGAVAGCVLNYAGKHSKQTIEGDRTTMGDSNALRQLEIDLSPK